MAKNFTSPVRNELETFIDELNLPNRPTIHINGREHPTAIVVVDFGAPLKSVRLTSDQNQELTSKLRKFTKELLNRDVYIRVGSDNYGGTVYWSAITQ